MKLDSFQRGRSLATIAAIGALFLIASIAVGSSLVGRALLIGAVTIGIVFSAAFISSQKKAEGISKDARRRAVKIEEKLSILEAHFENQTREKKTASLQELGDTTNAGAGEGAFNRPNIFAPNTIPATRILARPTAHSAGRLAAEQVMERDGFVALSAMMTAEAELWTREISLIGPVDLEAALSEVGRVHRLAGPYLLGSTKQGTSYLIIDEQEFWKGPWEGLLSAQKTGLYLRLVEHIADAQNQGIVVIVRASNLTSHFTNDLRERANIVLNTLSPNWAWSEDLKSPVLEALKTMDAAPARHSFAKGEN
ncbi:hypothetical protein [Corynebacterium minutissimum]|uniref:Uncharacterized protein n=1 Tax=Corynebacterium minutissimum TaxID=38301 RepID=A0A376D1X9_9CORY|nr:hypothetical protein [Corynebacterium minutissimum]QRP61483.1 hypothetical protein I6J26_02745 [Corynebacterium minutissimum]STC79973.1 Uncharacterised protein [Corynebacterium minutissimum]